jgi:hypothetical protein
VPGQGPDAALCALVRLRGWSDRAGTAMLDRQAEQSRRFAFEESPDITGKGGR